MNTHESSRTGCDFPGRRPLWKALILTVLLPLAGACTDTVTGLDLGDHEEDASSVDRSFGSSDRPVAL